MYLCKNSWVKKKTATVGLKHGHVLLYRGEPFAAKSCKEILHLSQAQWICNPQQDILEVITHVITSVLCSEILNHDKNWHCCLANALYVIKPAELPSNT